MNARILLIFPISLLCLLLASCGKDDETLEINDFTRKKTIILEPYKNYPYSMMNIWVKGQVNDTILIRLNSLDSKPILKLSGKVDERWYTDYYGGGSKTIIFDPYKATKGSLEIKAQL
ncbi:MAG: hypothetical protein VX798_05875 [Bacteroidota bacterium]|uniref:Lipoprotein n=1 Tax=Flagellimonas profundi TaxID=2915620 RepID=A0ABS3FGB6_9FLAO|nr:hypothetical protein [Allomuricauda profundi]MBO0341962.1 hypothetical protein [Allomuricauda profundi]MEC7770693.1 hypothetical protein [Bacteroidota bacterium]